MNLTNKQIKNIDRELQVDENRTIVEINVSEFEDRETCSLNEICNNIYCVDKKGNIIWQIQEIMTTPPFDGEDPFCYIEKKENGDIIAHRFSGFYYKINPETGEAIQIGFHK